MYKTLHIGFSGYIPKSEVEFIVSTDSSPSLAKKIVDQARREGKLIDITRGKGRRSLVLTKSGNVYLSNNTAENLNRRFNKSHRDLKQENAPDTM